MLHLWVEKQTGAEARIPLRWCVDKETVDTIKERGVTPYLLIVVVTDGKEYKRKLVPLDQMMEYISFRNPGINTVNAACVCNRVLEVMDINEHKEYHVRFHPSDEGEINFSFLEDNYLCNISVMAQASVRIDVAQEFFAPEPPRWLLRWATHYWGTPLTDQCDFRKRIIFSFTVQPFLVFVSSCIEALALCFVEIVAFASALFLLSLGMRNIQWGYVIWPWNEWPWEKDFLKEFPRLHNIWEQCFYKKGHGWSEGSGSIFIRDRTGKQRTFGLVFLPFMPLILLGFFCIILFAMWLSGGWRGWPIAGIDTVVMATIFSMISLIMYLLEKVDEHCADTLRNRPPKEEKLVPKKETRVVRPELDWEAIVCDGAPSSYSVKSLPKPKRTFHLRIEEFKQRVCRPFATK